MGHANSLIFNKPRPDRELKRGAGIGTAIRVQAREINKTVMGKTVKIKLGKTVPKDPKIALARKKMQGKHEHCKRCTPFVEQLN